MSSLLLAVLAASLGSCSEPMQREIITVLIDADSIVRDDVARVDAVLEFQDRDSGWQTLSSRRFDTTTEHLWPLSFRYVPTEIKRGQTYQLSAIARDSHEALVARASVIRKGGDSTRLELRLHFDAACLRRDPLCEETMTCRRGNCVSPIDDGTTPADHEGPTKTGAVAMNDPSSSKSMTMADRPSTNGEPCDREGARECMGNASRVALLCEGSRWRAQPECPEDERCNTAAGASHGQCQPIAPECRNQKPNVVYCEGEEMRICVDLVVSTQRPCGKNEHCVVEAGASAMCKCLPGFVDDVGGCREATDCDLANGGCDPLTRCTAAKGSRVCGACPAGYGGTGDSGCAPLLSTLRIEGGELDPTFSPSVTSYRVKVPLLVQRVTLFASAPGDSRVETNATPIDAANGWTGPALGLGDTTLKIVATSSFGVHTDYEVVVTRAGMQEAHVKSIMPRDRDNFGVCVAASGETIAIGAPGEDGGIDAPNGAPSPAVDNGGAVYIVAHGADGWVHQAYLKPNDIAEGDAFGSAVALEADTLIATSAHGDKYTTRSSSLPPGAAYMFTRTAGAWKQTQRIQPRMGQGGDLFGSAVALEKDTLAIGAVNASGSVANSGAVYVFTREGDVWTERATLVPERPVRNGAFGSALALSDDTLAVASIEDIGGVSKAGAVYVFVKRGDTWMQQQRLQADAPGSGEFYGFALALSHDLLLASAISPDVYRPTPRGQVHVFERSGERWTRTSSLASPSAHLSDFFGAGLALQGTNLVIGTSGDSYGGKGVGAEKTGESSQSGAVWLYSHAGNEWVPSGYLKCSDTRINQALGRAVAIAGDAIIAAAPFDSGGGAGLNPRGVGQTGPYSNGSVYIFR